jgi:hypothetical protein
MASLKGLYIRHKTDNKYSNCCLRRATDKSDSRVIGHIGYISTDCNLIVQEL